MHSDDVVRALEMDLQARKSAYNLVTYITQLVLEGHFIVEENKEISWREILRVTRAHSRGCYYIDIATLVAKELIIECIKSWKYSSLHYYQSPLKCNLGVYNRRTSL